MPTESFIWEDLLCAISVEFLIAFRYFAGVLPLTFLSGTFYSISRLPEFWQKFAHFNPFFYNIDGFRYAFLGKSDSSLLLGSLTLVFINSILLFLCYLMFKTGYKLKS